MRVPNLTPVDSSSIQAVGYLKDEAKLCVRFVSHKTYIYMGVPLETYRELMRTESKGRYFNREVRDSYDYFELEVDGTADSNPKDSSF